MILAHGLQGRADLPIPDWLFAWAAALVLAASFFVLAVSWRRPRLETARDRRLLRVPRVIAPICGAIGVVLLGFLLYAGFAGTQESDQNLLPAFVYVFFWAALPLLSAVFGDLFRAFNPWLALGRAGRGASALLSRRPRVARLQYPELWGRWPAVLMLFTFGFIELVLPSGRDPSVLAELLTIYTVIQCVGMTLFGAEQWIDRGEAFNVYFNLFSRMSPLAVKSRVLVARLPLSGLTDLTWLPGGVAFFCTAIGITAFDGTAEGAAWKGLADPLESALRDVGLGAATAAQLAGILGMLAMISLIGGIFRIGVAGMASAAIGRSGAWLAGAFAPSLTPIMLAYVLAHYLSLIVFQGQSLWPLASDPLGHGADVFGTADAGVRYGWISGSAIWYLQAGVLLTGHVLALLVAHDKALALWGNARAAVRAQMWMLVMMVGFTNLGLWLLSQANR